MSWTRALAAPLLMVVLAPPAPAGIFSRKPKANPAERVPELLIQLKTEKDEGKRSAAAEELRQYDPKTYPEIATGLIDALTKDASTAVRAEAAASLGKLRPISQQAGYALEQATANDSSMRVRMAARQALWQYNLVGYRSGKPMDAPAKPNEPTASAPPGPSTPASAMMPRTSQRVPTGPFRETVEPPLADPVPATGVAAAPTPAPRVPAPAQLVPVHTPKLVAPPASPAAARKPAKSAAPPTEKPADPKAPAKADGPELPPF